MDGFVNDPPPSHHLQFLHCNLSLASTLRALAWYILKRMTARFELVPRLIIRMESSFWLLRVAFSFEFVVVNNVLPRGEVGFSHSTEFGFS